MWHWRNRGEEQGNEGAPEVQTLLAAWIAIVRSLARSLRNA